MIFFVYLSGNIYPRLGRMRNDVRNCKISFTFVGSTKKSCNIPVMQKKTLNR